MLLALCTEVIHSHAIIFVQEKKTAHRLKILFGLSGLRCSELHGNLTQTQRLDALEQFRDAGTDFLIATDLAARGLDIVGVRCVVNFTLPSGIREYIHRVGRTARAGAEGFAVSFSCTSDRSLLKHVLKKAKKTCEKT